MKLSAPKVSTFVVALVLAVLGLIGYVATVSFISTYAFWFLFAGFVLLALAVTTKGL